MTTPPHRPMPAAGAVLVWFVLFGIAILMGIAVLLVFTGS